MTKTSKLREQGLRESAFHVSEKAHFVLRIEAAKNDLTVRQMATRIIEEWAVKQRKKGGKDCD